MTGHVAQRGRRLKRLSREREKMEEDEEKMEMRDGAGGRRERDREKGKEIFITTLPVIPNSVGLCLQGDCEGLGKLRNVVKAKTDQS